MSETRTSSYEENSGTFALFIIGSLTTEYRDQNGAGVHCGIAPTVIRARSVLASSART